jgi:hypothetical protein
MQIVMKNVHILPTDKPSRLLLSKRGNLQFLKNNSSTNYNSHFIGTYQNIYITNDEEIKEGDYVIQVNFEKTNTQVIKCQTESQTIIANSKDGSFTKNKIILTTDTALISNGVQAIQDDFLEWFVKNPSCEEVEVVLDEDIDFDNNKWIDSYHIIIPKEEPKQETLEEAYNKIYKEIDFSEFDFASFAIGAKWQQARSYSEEDMRKAIQLARLYTLDKEIGDFVDLSGLTEICTYGLEETHSENSIIEQFKKK